MFGIELQLKGRLVKINKIDGEIFVIDDFLARGEKKSINHQLKGSGF